MNVRPIKDLCGYYITDSGDVYSRKGMNGRIRKIKGHLGTKKYMIIGLSNEGKRITKKVHRLVAEAFIPNPDKKSQVNHLNGDKSDNRVDNLEWCTNAENNLHSYRVLGHKKLIGKESGQAKAVVQIKDGKVIREFGVINEAARANRIGSACISRCCNGKQAETGGFKWKFK